MVSEVSAATELVVTVKVAEVAFAATVTLGRYLRGGRVAARQRDHCPAAWSRPGQRHRAYRTSSARNGGGIQGDGTENRRCHREAGILGCTVGSRDGQRGDRGYRAGGHAEGGCRRVAATVTLAGTWAAAVLLLDRVTNAPPTGAGPLSVTVPVEVLPPMTDAGLKTDGSDRWRGVEVDRRDVCAS